MYFGVSDFVEFETAHYKFKTRIYYHKNVYGKQRKFKMIQVIYEDKESKEQGDTIYKRYDARRYKKIEHLHPHLTFDITSNHRFVLRNLNLFKVNKEVSKEIEELKKALEVEYEKSIFS